MPSNVRIFPLVATLLCLVVSNCPAEAVDFVHEVLPILQRHCAKCHAGARKEGGLSMNSRAALLAGGESGAAVVVGKAAESEMLARILAQDEGLRMPPEGPRVSAKEAAVLKGWINAGLPWEDGVALGKSAWEPPLAPRSVKLPPPRNGRTHPIDRLLDDDLTRHERAVPPPIGDAAFFRRASLDAVGLLPTPEALAAFENDPATDKRDRLIDRLLADEVAYADHWLTMWNDLLRNDYTGTGFITGGRQQITPWLYRSLRENKPYDEMVRELIAPAADSAGFINGIQWRGDTNASQTREIQFAQNVSQVFLGINMKCASCHDSFIDRWKLSDAYGLAAIFSTRPLEIHRCDKPTGKMAAPRWIFPELGQIDAEQPQPERLRQLAGFMTDPNNGRFSRTLVNRVWHRLMGRGIVHPVDAMHTEPWNEDLLDYLAVRFAKDGYDLRKFIGWVMKSQAYQSRAVVLDSEPGKDYVYAGPLSKRMTAEQYLDSIWQITKAHPRTADAPVDRAPRPSHAKTEIHVEAVAANWIWHPAEQVRQTRFRKTFVLAEAPRAARLMATCDNAFTFKLNGHRVAASRDWQKPRYVDVARQLKRGENLIEVDAEMFGGSSGLIAQLDVGGRQPLITDSSWEAQVKDGPWKRAAELGRHGVAPWGDVLDPKAPAAASGSLAPPVRASLVRNDFLMRSLGRPNRDQVVTTRPTELTTLQAIDLANGATLSTYLKQGADDLLAQEFRPEELSEWLFRYALARAPTREEQAVLQETLGENPSRQSVEDALWMVFMLPEFQVIQ